MPTTAANNKRIAKNTGMLYIRMFLMMGISLYTSRVVLQTLGVDDFGIYNVIGGIVVLFSFVNNALIGASQRFLNFEQGRGDETAVGRVFSVSLMAHLFIALLVILLGETVGLWLLYAYIKIPAGRFDAALWVFHLSVAGAAVNILRAPYNAAIIAYEKMSAYAYISIIEAVAKLGIVYILIVSSYDKLELYALLTFAVITIISLCYKLYCNRHFRPTHFHWTWNKPLLKRLLSFSGWSLFGSAATVGVSQGINVLQNVFFGVAVNAAMGIATQVNGAINQFSSNFQMAFKPQIVKSYASGDHAYLLSLVCRSSKISYFLLFALSLPVMFACEDILKLWLGHVPTHASGLCRLMLVYSLTEAFSAPLWMVVQAVGRIKRYQVAVSAAFLLNLPLGYVALRLGQAPESLLLIQVAVGVLVVAVRLFFVNGLLPEFSIKGYLSKALVPCLAVTVPSLCLVWWASRMGKGLSGICITAAAGLATVTAMAFLIGLNRNERAFILNIIKRK